MGGGVRVERDGSVTGSTGVSVMATGANLSQAQLLVISVSGLVGIGVSIADAEIGTAAKVEALSNDSSNDESIVSTGGVTFQAQSANTAETHTAMGSGGGLAGVSVSIPTPKVAAATNASVDAAVTSGTSRSARNLTGKALSGKCAPRTR